MQNHHDSESTAADIAIVALGPGGLAAALYAEDSGKTVIAFTDRTEYIRGQWLSLSETTSDLLRQYTDYSDLADRMFWKKLRDGWYGSDKRY
ncbi:MAG: hypothetical protein NTU48_02435 [Legionellales bacterium]|nr:hypothetical protein [Legionellales bacterium]